MKKLTLSLVLIAGCLSPVTVMAQDTSSSTVGGTLSSEQVMLNNQAVTAVKSGEFKKAEQLYQALLQLGEFNYIWYQLGRTYARQDKCIEAYDAYSHVAIAPILDPEEYPPEMINDATQKGLAELDAQCSSKVVFTCSPSQMTLSVDGGVEFECSSKPVSLVPGRHSVYAKTSFGFNSIIIESVAGQVTNSKVDVVNYEEVATRAGVTMEEMEKKSKLFKALGYSFIGVGAAVGAAGAGLNGYYFFKYRDKHNTNNDEENEDYRDNLSSYRTYVNIGLGMMIGGGAMAIAGIVLVCYDAVVIQPQIEELSKTRTFNLSPVVSPEFSGFTLTGTF